MSSEPDAKRAYVRKKELETARTKRRKCMSESCSGNRRKSEEPAHGAGRFRKALEQMIEGGES